LADAFEHDQVEGLIDEETIGQLSGILYEIDSQGRIKIESKEQARARGVASPDRAEALMLALGQLPREYACYLIRDLSGLRSESSVGSDKYGGVLSGFREVPYDDEDDFRSLRARAWDALAGPLRWPGKGAW
jgi:hypothetical protein